MLLRLLLRLLRLLLAIQRDRVTLRLLAKPCCSHLGNHSRGGGLEGGGLLGLSLEENLCLLLPRYHVACSIPWPRGS